MLNLPSGVTIRPVTRPHRAFRRGHDLETLQRGTRAGDIAEVTLREMVAHLNVIEASIDAVGSGAGDAMSVRARDLLHRLELLAFSAARLQIPDIPRVTDALEALVLAAQVRRPQAPEDVKAALRHGVDVLMLLTHDKMRRMQGHAAAELRPATSALLDRVDRLIGDHPTPTSSPVKVAGL
jgi:hypothetical protein